MHQYTLPLASCRRDFRASNLERKRTYLAGVTNVKHGSALNQIPGSLTAMREAIKRKQEEVVAPTAAPTDPDMSTPRKRKRPAVQVAPSQPQGTDTMIDITAPTSKAKTNRIAQPTMAEQPFTAAEHQELSDPAAPKANKNKKNKIIAAAAESPEDQQAKEPKASKKLMKNWASQETATDYDMQSAEIVKGQITALNAELQSLQSKVETWMSSTKGTITRLKNELNSSFETQLQSVTSKVDGINNNLQQQLYDLEERLYQVSNAEVALQAEERQSESQADSLQRNETELEGDIDSVAVGVMEADNRIASLQERVETFVREKDEELKALWEDFRITHAEDSRRSDQLAVLLARKEQQVEALNKAVEDALQRQMDAEATAAKLLCALKEAEFRAHQVEQRSSLIVSGMSPYDVQAQPDESRAVRVHAMRDAALKAGAQSATSTPTSGRENPIPTPDIGTFMLPQHHTVQLDRTSYLVNASRSLSEAEDDPQYEQFIQDAVANTLTADTELRTMTDTFEDIPTSELPEDLPRRLTPAVAASTATDTVAVAQTELISHPWAEHVTLATEFRQRLPVELSDTEPDQMYQQFLQEVVERIADAETNTDDRAGSLPTPMDPFSTVTVPEQHSTVGVSAAGTLPDIQGQEREAGGQETSPVETMAPSSISITDHSAASAYRPADAGVILSSWGTVDSVNGAAQLLQHDVVEQVAATQTKDEASTQAASETPEQTTVSTSADRSEGVLERPVEGVVGEGLREGLTDINTVTSGQTATPAISSSIVQPTTNQLPSLETASNITQQEGEDESTVQESHIPKLHPDAIDKVFRGLRATASHSTGVDQDQTSTPINQSPLVDVTNTQEQAREAAPTAGEEEDLAAQQAHIPRLRIEAIHDVFDTLRAEECHTSATPALSPRAPLGTHFINAVPGRGDAADVAAGVDTKAAQSSAVESHEWRDINDDESMDDSNQTGLYTGTSRTGNSDEEPDVTTHPVTSQCLTQIVHSHPVFHVEGDESMDDSTEVRSYPGVTYSGNNDEEPDSIAVLEGLHTSGTGTAASSSSALTQPDDTSHPEEAAGVHDTASQQSSMPMSMTYENSQPKEADGSHDTTSQHLGMTAYENTSGPQAAASEEVSSQQQSTPTANVSDTATKQSEAPDADTHDTASEQHDTQMAEARDAADEQSPLGVTDQQHESQLDDVLGSATDPSNSPQSHAGNPSERAEMQASHNEPTADMPALGFHANMEDTSIAQEPTPQQHVSWQHTVFSASVVNDKPHREQDTEQEQQAGPQVETNTAGTWGLSGQTKEEFAAALKHLVETAHSNEPCVTPDMPRVEQPECMRALDGDEDDGSPLPHNLVQEHYEDT